MENQNRWGNSCVYKLYETSTEVGFTVHGGTAVYRCQRAAWSINPLPRDLKSPELLTTATE